MHMGKTAEAEDLVMSIRNKFPESSRASKLLVSAKKFCTRRTLLTVGLAVVGARYGAHSAD